MRSLVRLWLPCLASLAVTSACASAPVDPQPAGPRGSGPEPDTGATVSEPTQPMGPVEPVEQDIASLAAGGGLVFVRSEAGCETWVFSDGGATIARVGDPTPALSFQVEVTASAMTVSAPRAKSGPHVVHPECSDEPPFAAAVYVEEHECEAAAEETGTPVVGSCARTLLAEQARAELVVELDALEAEAQATRRAEARQRVAALKRALKKSKKVHWIIQRKGEGPVCQGWKVGRSKLSRKTDRGTASYGFDIRFDERLGRAFVDLTGPEWSGQGGSMGMGALERKPVTAVEGDRATVGDEQWYFSAQACEAAVEAP